MFRIVFKLLVSGSWGKQHAMAVKHNEVEAHSLPAATAFFFFRRVGTAEPDRSFRAGRLAALLGDRYELKQTNGRHKGNYTHSVEHAVCGKGHSQTHFSLEVSTSLRETHARATETCPVILWYLSCLFTWQSGKELVLLAHDRRSGHSECGMCSYTCLRTLM